MDLNELKEDLKENSIKYIKSIAMDLVVVLVAIAYVFYKMVSLETNELNPIILIAESIMGIICGIVIKQALGENGFSKGYNSQTWQDEIDLYNQACNTANPYMERVGNYYLCEEIELKRTYRRQHLLACRMRYEQWFDFDGNYIGSMEKESKLTRKQKRCLNKCIKVKIYIPNLFSEYGTATDEYTHKEKTDKTQKMSNLGRNTISAIIVAIVGVYFVPMLNSWSWASFIAATMQVALWVIFGVLQLYTNYDFVVHTKVASLRNKKESIKRFTSGCEKDLYKVNPYNQYSCKDKGIVA